VLPGNPSAAFVSFQKLVRPVLARLSGRRDTELPRLRARLDSDLHGRPGRQYFVLSRLRCEAAEFAVTPLANQCSALVRTAADANGLVTVRETAIASTGGPRRGDLIEVEVFDWTSVFGPSCKRDFRASGRKLSQSAAPALVS
jgi:molybdopterin molybdotransferase